MMGFPENHTAIELAASGMPLSLRQPSGSEGPSLITTKCSTEVQTVGLTISSDVTYEEWEDIGYQLARVGKGWQWWVGDWINFGEKKYGETYKAAIEATGLAYSSVKKLSLVVGQFALDRRRSNLSFNHHAEVQGLDPQEQDELLSEAESEGLSCAAVRERVRAMKGIFADSADKCVAENEGDSSPTLVDECLSVFKRTENRLESLRRIIAELEPFEAAMVRDWILERLH